MPNPATLRPRLLFYAVNGLGLGHVTRLLGIARAMRAQEPGVEILFVTTSEASHLIYREGFAALKLPSRAAANVGGLRQGSFLRLNQSVVWNAVTAFDPHCIVVDTFPAGSLHELLPLLRWPLRKVFVFRAQRAERAADPFLQNTLKFYDLVLVPHEEGSEQVPVPIGVKTAWTGTMLLRDPGEMLGRDAARAALGLPREGLLALLTLGGGGDIELAAARRMLRRALREQTLELPALTWVEAEGPLAREAGESEADGSQWIALRDVHPLMLYLHAFDFVVAAAGYNTVNELQAGSVPCVLWPFERDVDDQGARARGLAERGRALCLGEGAAPGDELVRLRELGAALKEIVRPATRDRLRAAMSLEPPGCAGWENGAAAGAAEILRLFVG